MPRQKKDKKPVPYMKLSFKGTKTTFDTNVSDNDAIAMLELAITNVKRRTLELPPLNLINGRLTC